MNRIEKSNNSKTGRYGGLRDHISRLRHRRGFGIHSPFGYRLIKDALYLSPRYGYYAESDIDELPLSRNRKRQLRQLLRVAAFMGIRKAIIPPRAPQEIRATLKWAGATSISSSRDTDADMIVDFEGIYTITDIRTFLEGPGKCVWQKYPSGGSESELPGDLIIQMKDSYLAFSKPGMARTLYKI